MRSRRVVVTSRITSLAPLVRGKPDDNGDGRTAAYKAVVFLIPKKGATPPAPKKRRKLKMTEKILFGRKPDKNIHASPEREGMRRSLSLREKDILSLRRGPWRRREMKKRHQMWRRRKINLGRLSADLQIV